MQFEDSAPFIMGVGELDRYDFGCIILNIFGLNLGQAKSAEM